MEESSWTQQAGCSYRERKRRSMTIRLTAPENVTSERMMKKRNRESVLFYRHHVEHVALLWL